jgi:threonine dehydrogenase-like Zn-dependent dehydrogenase
VSPGTERATILGLENTGRKWPVALGYSACGVVEETGEGAVGFTPGRRVACFTLKHQEKGNVKTRYCAPVPDGVDDPHAAVTALAQISLQAVRKTRIEIGEGVAVFGLGPIGQIALAFARVAGAHPLVGIDRVATRLERAARLGADITIDTSKDDWRDTLATATAGRGPNVVIESTGFPEPVALALEIAAPFGRVALLGSTRAGVALNPYAQIHRPGLTVIGAHVTTVPAVESRPGYWTWADDAGAYLRLVEAGRLDLSAVLEAPVPAAKALSVYERIIDWSADILVPLLDWRAGARG